MAFEMCRYLRICVYERVRRKLVSLCIMKYNLYRRNRNMCLSIRRTHSKVTVREEKQLKLFTGAK